MKKIGVFFALFAVVNGFLGQGCREVTRDSPSPSIPDPTGYSRRHPESMHAHQSEWPAKCLPGNAKLQSPIALTTSSLPEAELSPITIKLFPSSIDLVDVGHTFQGRYLTGSIGGIVEFEGASFELTQFHFHKPAEHLIDGKQYDMEVHFVFVPQEKEKLPKAFVLGFPIGEGKTSSELEGIWKHLPPYKEAYGEIDSETFTWTNPISWIKAMTNHELRRSSSEHEEKVLASQIPFDLSNLIPEKTDFIVYKGSLTTPSCDEEITHAVALNPIQFGHEQIEHFEGYYEGSNRDIQPIGSPKERNFRRGTMKR